MGKYVNIHKKVTSWVAIIIIIAIGSTFGYFIWTNANESWGNEYTAPTFNAKVTKLLNDVETVGWSTHQDLGFGFQIRHPQKYSKTIDIVAQNSLLGSAQYPVPGASIGPLVLVKADTAYLKNLAEARFDHYWNYASKLESPTNYCKKQVIDKPDMDIRITFCLINGKEENFALIKGTKFDMFVDGYTNGYDKRLTDAYGPAGVYVSQSEFFQMMSTFKFVTASS